MDFNVIVPWIAVALSMLGLIFGRSDKGKAEDEEMKAANVQTQFDIKEIKLILKNMEKDRDDAFSRQKSKEKEQDDALEAFRKRNSDSHAELHEKIRELDKRMDDQEHRCDLIQKERESAK